MLGILLYLIVISAALLAVVAKFAKYADDE